jgi:hypothetical protein
MAQTLDSLSQPVTEDIHKDGDKPEKVTSTMAERV